MSYALMDFLLTLLVLLGIIDAALLAVLLLGAVVALNKLGTVGSVTGTRS